ncbi:MAG: cardiolipin synthase [Blautia sp.]|nr:cardiolipin synthase [Blautia sp.]
MERVKPVLKKIYKILFNRILFVIAAASVQVGWVFLNFYRLTTYSPYLSLAVSVLVIIVVLVILNEEMDSSYKLFWVSLILGLHLFGLVLFLLAVQSRKVSGVYRQYNRVIAQGHDILKEEEQIRVRLAELDPNANRQSVYIRDTSDTPLWGNTTAEYFQVGDEMFPALIRELEAAKHYIFIEYFIINNGFMWNTILDILEQKAKEGVDVRLIYDDFGCMNILPIRYYEKLRAKGIKCEVFNPFRFLANVVHNNRDHRKFCIIDGNVGLTGGINLSDEYINRQNRFGYWKDTAILLRGDAVRNMTFMFLNMWATVTKAETLEEIHYQDYLAAGIDREGDKEQGEGYFQPFGDSPLDHEPVGQNVYISVLGNAQSYVYIFTPYLIVDNEMMSAFCLAAKSGVDIRIITPGIPDKKLVFLVTQSYYERLLRAGVKIYEYQPGFLHAKSFVCDDKIAVCGTINLDYRSLFLHFEDGVWIYDNPVIEEIKQDFLETLKQCRPIDLDFVKKRNPLIKALQVILRLSAPAI